MTAQRQPSIRRPSTGFTLTELLVAIGIIALLIGLLLPALSAVNQRAKKSATAALMEQFANACNAFQQQFGYVPGLVPEDVLAYDTAQSGGVAKISGTENAILHLMGGGVRADDEPAYFNSLGTSDGWVTVSFQRPAGGTLDVKVNVRKIGDGPRIGGKQYPPFFTAKASELLAVTGQAGANGGGDIDFDPNTAGTQGIPDLVDGWGQPIMFLRAARSSGPLMGNVLGTGTTPPSQFGTYALTPYIKSLGLGELGKDQTVDSLFNVATGTESGASNTDAFAAQVVRHAGFGDKTKPTTTGTARGRFVLFSAGKDGLYFSRYDGPGSSSNAVTNIITSDFANGGNFGPQVVDNYDDVRVFGGS